MKEAVIFDFGRVISAQKPLSLFDSYERDLGIETGTMNTIMFESEAWRETLLGRKTYDEFWQAIGPSLGLTSPSSILCFQKRYQGDERLNEEVADIIHGLRGRCKLAVLSNAPPGLSQWLADWGILNWFHVVFCSGDEGLVKPDPRVFHTVLERLDVEPSGAVFVDDTLEHVQAAKGLGIDGLLFSNARELERELSKFVFRGPSMVDQDG
ncbi:MAG: HAD family phosphatase [Syntrophobacteraceae bacterium]|nr:HAD family phosphatase [Syntrophobacteraceae bacterium]